MTLAGREKMTHTTRREKTTRENDRSRARRRVDHKEVREGGISEPEHACDVYRGFFVVIFSILFLESH